METENRTKSNNKPTIIIGAILLILVVGILAVVYYRTQQAQPTDASYTNSTAYNPPPVDVKNNGLVTNFPSFPVYPKGTITSSQYSKEITSPYYQPAFFQVYLETNESAQNVIDWYETELKNQGWNIDSRSDIKTSPTDQSINISNNIYTASINAEKENDATDIAIYISPVKK